MIYTHLEPKNTNGSHWTWVRKPLFRSFKSVRFNKNDNSARLAINLVTSLDLTW